MRLPPHVMALELRLFSSMLEKAAGNGPLPDMINDFVPHLGKRELTLNCPREEILVSGTPSFIFVMNEELLGVYPTDGCIHIRKPLKGGEEVMVLKPGIKGEAVYYYDSNNKHLFVLHDEMLKISQYDLSVGPKVISTITVHGLHDSYGELVDRKPELVCTAAFFFILDSFDRLFCIDRADVSGFVQAKSIWCADSGGFSKCCLSLRENDPLGVTILGHHSEYRWTRIHFELKYRKDPLYFRALSEEVSPPAGSHGVVARIAHICPLSRDLIVATTFPHAGYQVARNLHLIDYTLKALGHASETFEVHYNKTVQAVTSGGKDIIYTLAVGDTYRQSQWSRDNAGFAGNNPYPNKRQRQSSSCKISSYYLYKD